MITTQVVETSVTVTNSPIEDYTHPVDLISPTNDPVFFFLTKQGEGPGLREPPPPPLRTDDCLILKFWHRQNHNRSYIAWNGGFFPFFLTKRALHFATKLNSRDIQKCNCFWVQGIITCNRDWWEGVRGRRYFWTKVLTSPSPPPPRSQWKIPGSAPAKSSVEPFYLIFLMLLHRSMCFHMYRLQSTVFVTKGSKVATSFFICTSK